MPVIETTQNVPLLAQFAGSTVVDVIASVPIHALVAPCAGKTTVTVSATGGQPLITVRGSTSVIVTALTFVPTPNVCAGSTTGYAQANSVHYDSFELRFTIDVIAAGETGSYRAIWLPRIKASGVEVPVISATYSEPRDSVGATLQVRLARLSDKALFTAGTPIEFGIGQQIEGVWDDATFDVIFSTGEADSRSHSIEWNIEDHGPTDAATVTISSEVSLKLAKTALTDCVIYDSAKQTLSQSDFNPLYDTEGRQYLTELKPISGLSLYSLLHEVAVTRCGFTAYKTNLPDFPIARVDCSMGRGWMDAIRGAVGIFEPVLFITNSDDTLWLIDTGVVLPAGFPTARTVAISDYRKLEITDAERRIDGFIVSYTEDKRNFDYVTTRVETETRSTGTFPAADYTNTFIERGFREYRKYSQPAVVLRDELYYKKETVSGAFTSIGETTENYTFDELGRLTLREKIVKQRLPDINTGTQALRTAATETESILYAAHPFVSRAQYISRRETNTSGLIVTDSDNQQLGQDFKMAYTKAYRNGNLQEGQTSATGAILTRIETAEPKRSGQVTIKITEIDHLTNTVVEDVREDRTGDVTIYGTQPVQNRVLVLSDTDAVRTTDRLDDLSVGELPIINATALARRLLRRRKSKMRSGTPETIGYEKGLTKGLPITLTGRDAEALGNYLLVGRSIKADGEGAFMQLEVIEI